MTRVRLVSAALALAISLGGLLTGPAASAQAPASTSSAVQAAQQASPGETASWHLAKRFTNGRVPNLTVRLQQRARGVGFVPTESDTNKVTWRHPGRHLDPNVWLQPGSYRVMLTPHRCGKAYSDDGAVAKDLNGGFNDGPIFTIQRTCAELHPSVNTTCPKGEVKQWRVATSAKPGHVIRGMSHYRLRQKNGSNDWVKMRRISANLWEGWLTAHHRYTKLLRKWPRFSTGFTSQRLSDNHHDRTDVYGVCSDPN